MGEVTLLLESGPLYLDSLAPTIVSADGAGVMREACRVALRALAEARGAEPQVAATLTLA